MEPKIRWQPNSRNKNSRNGTESDNPVRIGRHSQRTNSTFLGGGNTWDEHLRWLMSQQLNIWKKSIFHALKCVKKFSKIEKCIIGRLLWFLKTSLHLPQDEVPMPRVGHQGAFGGGGRAVGSRAFRPEPRGGQSRRFLPTGDRFESRSREPGSSMETGGPGSA